MKIQNLIKKLIKEQILLLESEDVIKHNLKIIMTKAWDDQSGSIYYSIFTGGLDISMFTQGMRPEDMDEEDRKYVEEAKKEMKENVMGLINNIEVLRSAKIVKPITGKSFGKVFKMSNGHILKLFSDSLNVQEDLEWYKDNYDKMFLGTANKNTLPIYDFGTIQTDEGQELHYVEMAELMPLNKWIAHTGRGDDSKAIRALSPLISFYEEVQHQAKKAGDKLSKEEAIHKTMLMIHHRRSSYQPLTMEEAEAILGAFWESEEAGWSLSDVAARNLAVMTQSDPNNPTIIIFDR